MNKNVMMCSNDGRTWDVGIHINKNSVVKRLRVKKDDVQKIKEYKYLVPITIFDFDNLEVNIEKTLRFK